MDHIDTWEQIPSANLDEQILLAPLKAKIRYGGRQIHFITATDPGQPLKIEKEYRNGIIHPKVVEPDLPVKIEVEYRNGTSLSWNTTHINVTFCMMWGIPLSFDCRNIFAPQKHGGLWCLSVEDGTVKWKTKSRAQFKQVLVNVTGSLCCAASEHDIVILDGTTGTEQIKKRISWINDFAVLGTNRILVEANSKQWHILNSETLEVVEIIYKKELNLGDRLAEWEYLFQKYSTTEDDNFTV